MLKTRFRENERFLGFLVSASYTKSEQKSLEKVKRRVTSKNLRIAFQS